MGIVKLVLGVCFVALFSVSLPASPVPDYQIGDKAAQDIVAAAPFDVVNAKATADLKSSQAEGIAAIYHRFNGQTNLMAANFLTAFAQARKSFSNAVAAAYHEPVIDNSTIEASDFGYLVTTYNAEHKSFPVTTELAVTWARGGSGAAVEDTWLGRLLQAMKLPVQPDAIPAHFVFRKKVRIMPLTNVNEKFTFTQAWRKGYIISLDKIPRISVARAMFRQQFSEGEQTVAGALAQFIQPDCFPDVDLTRLARDYSVRRMIVSDHFDAGQIIVHRGDKINEQALAALAAMTQATTPEVLNEQIAAQTERVQQEHELAQAEQQQARIAQQAALLAQQQQRQAQADRALAQKEAVQEMDQAAILRAQAVQAQLQAQKIHVRNEWLGAFVALLFLLGAFVFGRWLRQQRDLTAPARLQLVNLPAPEGAGLAPYLAQTLKEAVVQGLAAQRAELLEAQRMAAVEIAELVHRLDLLQAPMQERLRAYQERIQELQKELAERTEENRELLKMKIEMMKRHIEMERGRIRFN
ncbi:MAG TPA: hypothetical protein VGV18_04400 [Verrucomicrobiae bacterium]|nr:hypothetical protein [Verrucomicrobiae bacterium]